jgi:hypothetical protein
MAGVHLPGGRGRRRAAEAVKATFDMAGHIPSGGAGDRRGAGEDRVDGAAVVC